MIRDCGDTGSPVLNLIIGLVIIIGLPILFYQIDKTDKDTSDRPGGRIEELRDFLSSNEDKIEKIVIIMDTVDKFKNSEVIIKNKLIIKEFKDIFFSIKKENKVATHSPQKYLGLYFITFYVDANKFYSVKIEGDPSNEDSNKSFIIFFKNSFFDMPNLEWEYGFFPNYFKAGNGYSGNTYIDYQIHKSIVHVKNLTNNGHNRKEQVYIHYH